MTRVVAGVVLGFLLTGVACALAWTSLGLDESGGHGPVYALALGGLLGSLVAGISSGAQLALLERDPKSNASLGAMVAGFFAKLAILTAGILLLHFALPAWSPVAFGVAFFVASAVVSVVVLSAMARPLGRRDDSRSPKS